MTSHPGSLRRAARPAFGTALLAISLAAGTRGIAAGKTTYEADVLPLLRNACLNCHNGDKKKADLDASTYEGLMTGGSSGKAVVAGNVTGSLLWRLVNHDEEPHMPPKGPRLGDPDLAVFRRWIEGGLLENAGSKAQVPARPSADVPVASIVRGRPDGPPPMPGPGFPMEPAVHALRPGAISSIAASPWAPLIAVSGQRQVLLYHADTLAIAGILPFPEGFPYVLQFSSSGRLLLVGGGIGAKVGKVALHDVATGRRLALVGDELDSVIAADISPDHSRVAVGGAPRTVRVIDARTGGVVQSIRKHTDWVTAVAYSPDGVLLATADRAGGLHLWEAATLSPYGELRIPSPRRIASLAWRDDGNALASAGDDGNVWMWDVETLASTAKWKAHEGGVECVRFAHDGRVVTVGRDKKAALWDAKGGKARAFDGLPDIGLQVAVTHDGARVVAGDFSGKVRVWGSADGKMVGELDANPVQASLNPRALKERAEASPQR